MMVRKRRYFRRAVPLLALLVLILIALSFLVLRQQSSVPTPTTDPILSNRRDGREMQALYHIEVQAAQSGWTFELARTAGDIWRSLGDMSNAVAYWEIALTFAPSDANLTRQVAQAYIDLQEWARAANTLERLVTIAPDEVWGHYQLGLLRAPFDSETAISHLQIASLSPNFIVVSQALLTVLQENGSDPLLAMHVGMALGEQGLWAYAEIAFAHAADLFAPFPEALAYTGLARDWQGKDGSTWIEQAVELAPENSQVLFVQGIHLRLIGDLRGSLDALLLALSLDAGNPAICAELAETYRQMGDLASAGFWFQQAVQFSNNDPEVQRLLALFYAEEAVELAALGLDVPGQINTLAPTDADAHAELAWSFYQAGDVTTATREINAALSIDPLNSRALYYQARMLLDTGNTQQAVSNLQLVAVSGSEFAAEAQRILESLGY
jgi:tetratricopeptide (TPR) repeat protein